MDPNSAFKKAKKNLKWYNHFYIPIKYDSKYYVKSVCGQVLVQVKTTSVPTVTKT